MAQKLGCLHSDKYVMLVDANAPLADHESSFFGMHHAEEMNQQGYVFQDFLVANELYVPSTFASHVGSSVTWHHPRGGTIATRLCASEQVDVSVCVLNLRFGVTLMADLDTLITAQRFVNSQASLCFDQLPKRSAGIMTRFTTQLSKKRFAEALATLPMPSWEVSIDDHSALLESNILQLATQHFGSPTKKKVRPALREATLAGIQLKRQALDMARKQGFDDDSLSHELKVMEKNVRAMVLADQKDWYADWLDSINEDWARHDTAYVYKRLQRLGRRKKRHEQRAKTTT